MIGREDIHNSAMLKPSLAKKQWYCETYKQTKKHAFAPVKGSLDEQCVDCGKVKFNNKEKKNGIHNSYTDR